MRHSRISLWMRRFILSLVVLTSCGCEPDVDEDAPVDYSISFDEYPVDTRFNVGDEIISPVVDISIEQGDWPQGGESPFGYAKIDDRGYARGHCNDVQLNNINVALTPHYSLSAITLRFGELGGRVALGVNGPPSEAEDLLDLDGVSEGGADVVVAAVKEGSNWYGLLQISGTIDHMTLGGQELWVDDVCLSIDSTEKGLSVLLDQRNGGGGGVGSLAEWVWGLTHAGDFCSALMARGYSTEFHTSGEITLSKLTEHDIYAIATYTYHYTASEKQALVDFVNAGGGLLIAGDACNYESAAQGILGVFGVTGDWDIVHDPTNHEIRDYWVVYDAQSHFITKCHPVLRGVGKIRLACAATVTGPGWDVLVQTDDDATSPNSCVVMSKTIGKGRVIVTGDASVFGNSELPIHDNRRFVLQVMDWLCFRI